MHNGLGNTHTALCVNLPTITSHHGWLPPYIGNNVFLPPKVQGECNRVENIWSLLRGITLWTLWIECNDLVFNNERWNVVKIHKVIWDALLDYGRVAWNR